MPAGPLTLRAVADLVGGRLHGDGECLVAGIAPLDQAGGRDLSFLTAPRYLDAFRASGAAAVLVPEGLAGVEGGPAGRIVVPDPAAAIAAIAGALFPVEPAVPGVDPTARLGPGVILGEAVCIGAGAVLGAGVRLGHRVSVGAGCVLEDGVEVGDDTELGPRVTCCRGTVIGLRCRIKAGAVLGGMGFGYQPGPDGMRRVPHVGRCLIEDDVDIGSNSCVDRGSIGDTVIGAGSRLDNLVQVGHNVRVGRNCLLMAQVGIAGSSRLGDGVVLAGQAGVAGHLRIGHRVRVSAQAGVATDLAEGCDYGGTPARPIREWHRSVAVLYALAPLGRELQALARDRKAHG